MFADDTIQDTGNGDSPRRPRRDDVVTLRVRIDLVGAQPAIWRRVELASDLYLDALHLIVQIAFDWTNSHLHDFTSGIGSHDSFAERYLNAYVLEPGEEGILESTVRLDEVLVVPGDSLLCTYDFGDNWEHVIRLEAVEPRSKSAPVAACVGGRRAAPPDDSGGIGGYEWMIAAARDSEHPDHDEAAEQFEYLDPDGTFDPNAFDQVPINLELQRVGNHGFSLDAGLGDL